MASEKLRQLYQTKVLHIDVVAQTREKDTLLRIAKNTIGETYVEEDPTVAEWLHSLVPTNADISQYVWDLFPSASWAQRYNLHWLLGDAIAGITVGLVVVPQAMAYALLARLPPAYGLYTTFTGACLYWVFGTSKDIVIGTTAVGSLLVGQVISSVEDAQPGTYQPQEIAHALSFLSGLILLFLGFFRLGWLIEFISYIPISAFVTSASITIISTQLPTLLGIAGVNTRESPYQVYVNTLGRLPKAKLDAAIGISSIVLLFTIQRLCISMEVRQPARKKMWGMISSLRLTFTVLLYTLVSWLVHRNTREGSNKFRIVGNIEKGFSHASIPKMDTELFGLIAKDLPAIIIILIVEHIAIAKNFGRIYGYKVTPSQEILAQGAANILSPFVGGYVCTGSFGASAVLSKAGVRTPLAGLFSAMVLVLALYALTAVFYYIPNAALAGLIIHATCNLITPPHKLYKYWQFSPVELTIWFIGVVLAIFTDLETSIYAGVALTFALMLVRMARIPGKFRGQTRAHRISPQDDAEAASKPASLSQLGSATPEPAIRGQSRDVFLPLQGRNSHNPRIEVKPPHPGVFIYRFSETLNYVNQAHHFDHMLAYILAHTRRTQTDDGVPPQDRLWSDARQPAVKLEDDEKAKPILRAVVLDLSTVNVIDVTSVQGLVDVRAILDRYAAPAVVEWHFVGVENRWTRRALAHAGFGRPSIVDANNSTNWLPTYTVSTLLTDTTMDTMEEDKFRRGNSTEKDQETRIGDVEAPFPDGGENGDVVEENGRIIPIHGVDRPFFHVDLVGAVDAAVRAAGRKDDVEA